MKKYSKTGEYNIEEFTNRMRHNIWLCLICRTRCIPNENLTPTTPNHGFHGFPLRCYENLGLSLMN
jgi:hypothetical protein